MWEDTKIPAFNGVCAVRDNLSASRVLLQPIQGRLDLGAANITRLE
jgi:hypothetical protein